MLLPVDDEGVYGAAASADDPDANSDSDVDFAYAADNASADAANDAYATANDGSNAADTKSSHVVYVGGGDGVVAFACEK